MLRKAIIYIMALIIVVLRNALKAALYVPALIYLFCLTYLIRAYVNTIIKLMKLHKIVFKYWIKHYFSFGPSIMIIKDEVDRLKTAGEAV